VFFHRLLFCGSLLGLFLLSSVAGAAIRPYSLALNPQAGQFFFEASEEIKDAPLYSLGFGYQISDNWSGLWTGGYLETKEETGQRQEVKGYLGSVEILYRLRPDRSLVPHLAAGLGFLAFDRDGTINADGFAEYGIGVQYFLGPSWSVSLDGRHLLREAQNFTATAGVAYYLGADVEEPQLTDLDGDGVIDVFDRCPDTRLGVPVDGYGCPADEDADGVPDYLDKCPDTPLAAPVDKFGCLLDRDKDGIADYLDACAGTPAGMAVDERGCEAAKSPIGHEDGIADPRLQPIAPPPATLANASRPAPAKKPARLSLQVNLNFRSGAAEILPEIEKELEDALLVIGKHPGYYIVVEGHTDSVGAASSNLRLSQQRAENVRKYLLEKTGIPPEMTRAQGYGGARPVADNGSQAGRAKNRRVIIHLSENAEM